MAAYSIILQTDDDGDELRPSSEVVLTLFGTKASSRELVLDHGSSTAAAAGGPTAKGAFVDLGDVDLGDITRVRVRHDDPGVGPRCPLRCIVVRALGTLEAWTFHCHDKLARHAGAGVTEHTLDVVGLV